MNIDKINKATSQLVVARKQLYEAQQVKIGLQSIGKNQNEIYIKVGGYGFSVTGMNSRQRRKLEAIQHNDAIRYQDWLIKNTLNQTRKEEVKIYQRERSSRMSRALILGAIGAMTYSKQG